MPLVTATNTYTMTAYDYKYQVWREGVGGTKLLMEQLSETLRLLRRKRGAEYAAFLGLKLGEAPEFITKLEKQVKDAEKELLKDSCAPRD